jgi:hypothetical protein
MALKVAAIVVERRRMGGAAGNDVVAVEMLLSQY